MKRFFKATAVVAVLILVSCVASPAGKTFTGAWSADITQGSASADAHYVLTLNFTDEENVTIDYQLDFIINGIPQFRNTTQDFTYEISRDAVTIEPGPNAWVLTREGATLVSDASRLVREWANLNYVCSNYDASIVFAEQEPTGQ